MSTRPGRITRTRPNLTCAPCRSRKVKCDKQKPTCAQCDRLDMKCFYDSGASSSMASLPSTSRAPAPGHRPPAPPLAEPPSQPGLPGPPSEDPLLSAPLQLASFVPHSLPAIPPSLDHAMGWAFSPGLESAYFNPAYPSLPEGGGGSYLYSRHEASHAGYVPMPHITATSGLAHPHTLLPSTLQPGHGYDSAPPVVEAAYQDMTEQANSETPSSGTSQPSLQPTLSPFWARAGKEKVDDTFLQQSQQRRVQSTFDEARWSRLCAILHELPHKAACDELLQAFLRSVRPLACIVHVPTLCRDYNALWKQDYQTMKMPSPQEAWQHASFFCLLWAVLFCGAAASSTSKPFAEPLSQDPDSPTSPALLHSQFCEVLSLSRQSDLPTMHGLVASLLVHECNFYLDEALDTPPLLSQSFLAARALGIHSEEKIASWSRVEAEVARRVWHHILWEDALATVCAGCTLSPSGDWFDTQMPLDISDQDLEALDVNTGSGSPRHRLSAQEGASSSMIYHIGRSEATRVFRRVVQRCYGAQIPTRQDLEELCCDMVCLFDKLDALTVKLKARGLPEVGRVSNRLFVADDPQRNPLHNDNPREETNFNAFIRIGFRFMKDFVGLQFTAAFLAAEGGQDMDTHASELYYSVFRDTSGVQVRTNNWGLELINRCISFLRNCLQLSRLPALSLYRWYLPTRVQPLQAAGLVVGHLEQNPTTPEVQELHYLLDEIFEIYLHPDGSPKLPFTGGPDSWNALQRRHQVIKAAYPDIVPA